MTSRDLFGRHQLRVGQEVEAVFWADDSSVVVGQGGCVSMEIKHVNGHMAAIPFVLAEFEDGSACMYSVHQAEGIKLSKEVDDE